MIEAGGTPMNKILGTLLIGLMLTIGGGGIVRAGSLEDGLAAVNRGDYATALRLFQPLAEQGNAWAQSNLGVMYEKGEGVAQDYREAIKWFRLAAAQGNTKAQRNLGNMYEQGNGVTQDYKEAIKWYRLSAEQGNADAQFNLGIMYEQGNGVTQDYKEAIKWYRLSAEQGNADAQYNLGGMYLWRKGVTQDYKEAIKWYRLSAEQGHAWARYNLGTMYQQGNGVAQDYKEAIKWYRLSAEQGHADAQNNLGNMYENGQGMPQDYLRAHMWYNLAASKRSGKESRLPTNNRDKIAKAFTPAQVFQAQEMARQCKETNYKQCGEPEINQTVSSATSVTMQSEGGIYVVPVLINEMITLNFVVDSGAADVSIPADVVLTLMRTGTLKESDFLGEKTYVLADGSKVPSQTFRIRSLKVGNKVIENVNGSVASVQGSLLLGQSFLGHFKSWSVDNTKHALVFE